LKEALPRSFNCSAALIGSLVAFSSAGSGLEWDGGDGEDFLSFSGVGGGGVLVLAPGLASPLGSSSALHKLAVICQNIGCLMRKKGEKKKTWFDSRRRSACWGWW
jgi:hypothetical protein